MDNNYNPYTAGTTDSQQNFGQQNTPGEPKKKEKKKHGFGVKLVRCVVLAAVFGIVAGGCFQGVVYTSDKLLNITKDVADITPKDAEINGQSNTQTGESKDDIKQSNTAVTLSTSKVVDVSDIADYVMPSIVAVTNTGVTQKNTWFGTYQQESESCGSGIIISQDEENIYIATNHHVISGAKTLTVTFDDGETVTGSLKGSDSSVDLAIISVALADVPIETRSAISVASVGESNDLKVGQPAIVIGNALGYGQSVTAGVISALDREVEIQGDDGEIISNKLIQTDAAVNPGNSGGALLNSDGQVIGIVSAKYSSTSVEGMGYAIPISQAFTILEQMIYKDVVSTEEAGYLGIAGIDVTSSNAAENMPKGVYVTQVVSGSAADGAGIEKGDIIVGFNGRSVSSMNTISNIMKYLPAGSEVEIEVAKMKSDYSVEKITVTLTNRNKAMTR